MKSDPIDDSTVEQDKDLHMEQVIVPGRDGSNPEAKDSNPNPNHFILLESKSESEST